MKKLLPKNVAGALFSPKNNEQRPHYFLRTTTLQERLADNGCHSYEHANFATGLAKLCGYSQANLCIG